jgi:8-oxo-dGTP pyrophosphatase MutT (NUDIX family)
MSSERRGRRSRGGRDRPQRRPGPDDREPLHEQSYGGLVLRGDYAAGTAEVVAIVPRGKQLLALPKGGGEHGEQPEDTAVREVREEAGVDATIRESLGEVTYWYRRSGRRVRKSVRFFLCDYVGGSTDDHDHEVTDARWIPIEEARSALGYPGERQMVEEALRLLGRSR